MKHSTVALVGVGIVVVLAAAGVVVGADRFTPVLLLPLGLLVILVWYLYEMRTVYVSGSGECYHKASCSTLGEEKTALPLPEAQRLGYRPCHNCWGTLRIRSSRGLCCVAIFGAIWLMVMGSAILSVLMRGR